MQKKGRFYTAIKIIMVLALAGAFFGTTSTLHTAKAGEAAEITNLACEPDRNLFEKIANTFEKLDIRRTVVNMFNAMIFDVTQQAISGRNLSQTQECSGALLYHLMQEYPAGSEVHTAVEPLYNQMVAACGADNYTEEVYEDCHDLYGADATLNLMPRTDQEVPIQLNYKYDPNSQTAGSLLGVAQTVHQFREAPVPVSLAYWWNDSAERVPFVGGAMAATVTYRSPFVTLLFNVWQYFRNLGMLVIAIIMLYIGIMILSRRKINPQTVVTAQMAIPRVAVAIVLIIFSYPIAAALTTVSWNMSLAAPIIGASVGFGTATFESLQNQAPTFLSIGSLVSMILSSAIMFQGVGFAILMLTMLEIITIVVCFIIASIKAIFIYFRMLFSVIFAPLTFAVGAVPGSEEATIKWFKAFLANALSLPAMFFIMGMTIGLGIKIILDGMVTDTYLTSGVISLLITPMIVIYGFMTAIKAPKIIHNWIVGDDKKPGGRR